MNWKSAITASLTVAFFATLIHQLVSTGGTYYVAPVDWEVVNNLTYQDAQKHLAERSKKFTAWESLKSSIYYFHFWGNALVELVTLFLIGLASCWIFNRKIN